MRIFHRVISVVLFSAICLWTVRCGDDEVPTMSLPSGCQAQGVHAISVLESELTCIPTNAFTDTEEAIGAPDAQTTGEGRTELDGIVSLGVNGSITLFMGSCIRDLPGPDLRVYQTVSEEAVEVQVAAGESGPFVSLGTQNCGQNGPLFSNFCDFDLAGSGLDNVRYVRVFDREQQTFPGAECDNAGLSPGADLDAVEVLHP